MRIDAMRCNSSGARALRLFAALAIGAALSACTREPEMVPVIECARFVVHVDKESEVNEARHLMHALAIEFDMRFVDEMPRWGAHATIEFERGLAAKFRLLSGNGHWDDKREVTVFHMIGGFPIHDPSVRSSVDCKSGEAEYFARVEAAFRARWPDGVSKREVPRAGG